MKLDERRETKDERLCHPEQSEGSKIILSEVCEFIVDCPHSTANDEGVGFPLVRTPNVGKGRLVYNDMHRVSEDVYNQRNFRAVPQEDDLIFAREAPAGNVALIRKGEKVCLGQRTVLLRPNKQKVDPSFLTYYLLAPKQQYGLTGTANGATVAHVNMPTIRNLAIELPDIKVQRKLGGILSAYDNLIENNQKQIKLLEEAAQRLYKQWFIDLRYPGHETTPIVDGLPKGWSVKTVDDIAEYINGYAFKPSDWQTKGYPIIKIKEMNEGVTADTPRNSGETIPPKYVIGSGDIVFSWSATLAAIIWDGETGLLNQHLFKVIPHKDFSREFVLQTIKNTLEEFQNLTTGSTMKHIQRGKLKEVKVNTPTSNIMKEFEKITEPIRNQILNKKKQILDLIQSRDRLLPKLMNGELEV